MPPLADLTPTDPGGWIGWASAAVSSAALVYFGIRQRMAEARKTDAEADEKTAESRDRRDQKTTEFQDQRAKDVIELWKTALADAKAGYARDLAAKGDELAAIRKRMDESEARERFCLEKSARQEAELKWLREDQARLRDELTSLKRDLRESGLRPGTDLEPPALRSDVPPPPPGPKKRGGG